MIKKISILAFSLVVLAFSAVSCIYPFNPDTEDGSGALVIEGDILIGRNTEIMVSRTSPLTDPDAVIEAPAGKVWVEDDSGTTYNGEADPDSHGKYTVNTQSADPSRNYRLHFLDQVSGKEYVSAWEPVCSAPIIDSLSYNLDYERSFFNVALSMHSLKESYFKWSYVEDWEYHSIYYSRIKAIWHKPISYRDDPYVTLEDRVFPEDDVYKCYNHAVSTQILTFSTEHQTDDRFVDLEFLPIPRNDLRISYIYRIVVDLEPLTKDAYLYWENIKTNSEYNGNLFAPTPSELVGNIRCVQEPDELVMGYVNVAQIARDTLVVRRSEVNFYKDTERYQPVETLGPDQWVEFYQNYYLPYDYAGMPPSFSETLWAPSRCVDCRERGGNFDVPDNWPPPMN